jgi:hypothetical protein
VIADVATTVSVLSRRMRPEVELDAMREVQRSKQGVAALADPGVMQLTCRKHRIRDGARDRAAMLRVSSGRVGPFWPQGGA